ncbi:MAG TPA: glycosyltransferase family 1 protein [Fimbriimonas sp.]|nr:glycosyltransferase family 1 protein [Fimbriimonas sp.]
MRIGLFAHSIRLDGQQHAGVSRSSQRLLEALIEHNEHEFVIFVKHDAVAPKRWTDKPNVKVVRTWAKTRLWNLIGRNLEPIKHRLDAWYSVSGMVPSTPFIPKGSLIHDIFWHTYKDTYTAEDVEIHRKMYTNIAKNSSFFTAVSHESARQFAELFNLSLDKFTVLAWGSGQAVEFNDEVLPRPELPTNNDYLFVISTLEPRKNLKALFRAYSLLLKNGNHPQLDLVVAGAKGWKTEGILELVQELGLADRIHFLGYVEDAVVPALYQHSKAAVTPSLEEGFGMPILEAMQYGTLVVSSNSPAQQEVGGDIPIYFDPKDEPGMARAIEEALSVSDRQAKIEAGKQRAKLFSYQISAERVLAAIQKQVEG